MSSEMRSQGRVSLPSDFTGQSPPVCDLISKMYPYFTSDRFFGQLPASPFRARRCSCALTRRLVVSSPPPIAGAPANSGTLSLCPPGGTQSALRQCLPHLRYARASVLGFLPFALHDPASVRGFILQLPYPFLEELLSLCIQTQCMTDRVHVLTDSLMPVPLALEDIIRTQT